MLRNKKVDYMRRRGGKRRACGQVQDASVVCSDEKYG